MRPIGKYVQAPDERKRYKVNYSDWLDVSETLATVTATVSQAALVVDGVAIDPDALGVTFYASGGVDGVTYSVLFEVTTTGGQTKEDQVLFVVRAPVTP